MTRRSLQIIDFMLRGIQKVCHSPRGRGLPKKMRKCDN